MAEISVDDIKRLKRLTGAGITDAKKALQQADGDFDKALESMRKQGLAKASKREDKEAHAGLIGSYVHDGRIGVLVEINCETDFVAKTDEFKELVKDLCLQVAASAPADVNELMEQNFIKNPGQNVGDYIKQQIAKLGENIIVKRFCRMELGETD